METMDYGEAAAYLKINEGTLRQWVAKKREGIPFHKFGKRVLFFREELEAWLARPHTEPTKADIPQKPQKEEPSSWDGRFIVSFSDKGADPSAQIENLPGKSVRMTPDDLRELARYLVDAATLCENSDYRGIKKHPIMRESAKTLSAVILIPHDSMKDLKTLSNAATRTNDPQATTPEKYAIRFIGEGLRNQLPLINQRLKDRNSNRINFVSVR